MTWIRLCSTGELASGAAQRFDVNDLRICLVRIENDFYAIGDRCSHADFSLAEGDVYPEDTSIECWKHGSTFSLKTGEAQNLPATKPVPVYQIRIDGTEVMVEIDE